MKECAPVDLAKWHIYLTVSTENTAPPKSTESRNSNSSVQIQIPIWICIARYRGIWVSRFGGFRKCCIFIGNCHTTYVTRVYITFNHTCIQHSEPNELVRTCWRVGMTWLFHANDTYVQHIRIHMNTHRQHVHINDTCKYNTVRQINWCARAGESVWYDSFFIPMIRI